MVNSFPYQIVVSYARETLSASVKLLSDLHYNRYSVFFNQQLVDVGPSHMIISKCVNENGYGWFCDLHSMIQDGELARIVGNEIDNTLH
jgi:hypothetical protein